MWDFTKACSRHAAHDEMHALWSWALALEVCLDSLLWKADGGVSHPADRLRDTPLGDAVQLTGRVRTLDPIVALF